jgi:hypothetical protein
MNDVRKVIYTTLVLFLLVVVVWVGALLVFSCGFNSACIQAEPKVARTSVPTLIPASHSEAGMGADSMTGFNKCQVSAADLVGAWVTAGSPDGAFPFSDVRGQACEGTYAGDIQPLFVENSLWYKGALGCVSCHNPALNERSGGLDLTSHDAVLMGSGRPEGSMVSKGRDVLGGGDWEKSAMFTVLAVQGYAPAGHSADSAPVNLIVFAGRASGASSAP